METLAVTSSNIDRVGYNPVTSHLLVVFKSGKRYLYQGVPESVYKELMAAESHGKFFNKYIRTAFAFTELDAADGEPAPTRMNTSIKEALIKGVRPGFIPFALFA